MTINGVKRLFERHSVCVSGVKGSGKDLLTANVVARRKNDYISNIDYTQDERYHKLKFEDINCGENTYKDFIEGKVKYYEFPYPKGTDVYISDAGIYLPSQYCNELNKQYPYLPVYLALSRHTSRAGVHVNCQHLGRVWDKIREQSDLYIRCRWSYVLFGKIVLQGITVYDKYESALNRIRPCKISVPMSMNAEAKQSARQYLDNFYNQHGSVKNHFLLYINKANYDTHHFEGVLKNGKKKTAC